MNSVGNNKKQVIALLGADCVGITLARRVAAGKKIVIGDCNEDKLKYAAKELKHLGYKVDTYLTDFESKQSIREFAEYVAIQGNVMYFIDTTGKGLNLELSRSDQLKQELMGTAYAIDEFSYVMEQGGVGLIITGMEGYMRCRLTPKDESDLAHTTSDQLLSLAWLQHTAKNDIKTADRIAKRAIRLRVQTAAATTWSKRAMRINSISTDLINTDRAGIIDDVAAAGAFLLSNNAEYITGIDLLIDGGEIARSNSKK